MKTQGIVRFKEGYELYSLMMNVGNLGLIWKNLGKMIPNITATSSLSLDFSNLPEYLGLVIDERSVSHPHHYEAGKYRIYPDKIQRFTEIRTTEWVTL